MFKTKTLLSIATLNGDKALVRRRSDDPHRASAKIATLQNQPSVAMTEKHPVLIPATLKSSRFAGSCFVGGKLAVGHDTNMPGPLP